MPLSDRWTRAQIRAAVRRELMDPNARWWGDTELNNYIDQYQDRVQDELELISGTATVTTSTSTLTLASVATDILRPDAIYWDNRRLVQKDKIELDIVKREWRGLQAAKPIVYYQDDVDTLSFWPPPNTAGTAVFEYPKLIGTFATDTATMQLPAWTRYGSIDYGAFRALLRAGAKFMRHIQRFRELRDAFMPEKYIALVPGGVYEKDLIEPEAPVVGVTVPGPITRPNIKDEVPGGTIDGSNLVFTLTQTPNPTISLKLFVDGVLMKQSTHYTLSGVTVTFISPFQPITGQFLFASYQYLS